MNLVAQYEECMWEESACTWLKLCHIPSLSSEQLNVGVTALVLEQIGRLAVGCKFGWIFVRPSGLFQELLDLKTR